jgi:prefoldin beta subunit
MTEQTEEKLKQIQLLEQNMQLLQQQKQQFQTQLVETESALKELSKSDESYKIIGNIMVKTEKEGMTKELGEKKDILDLRIQTLEKQEKTLKEKFKDLQTEVMDSMKKE